MLASHHTFFFFLACVVSIACPCTVIIAGNKATADGSAIVAHTDDAGPAPSDLRLVRVPAMHHQKGANRPIYPTYEGGYPRLVSKSLGPQYEPQDGQELTKPLGFIPQVQYTHGYWDSEYGLMNDVGLAMGESTCGAKIAGWPVGQPYGYNLFSINELSRVALERCATARCAVKIMGHLAEKYGFYGDDSGPPDNPLYVGASEALGIVDAAGEAWVFHVMTGPGNRSAIWAAQRVDGHQVTVLANSFIIREMNLSDTHNYLASPNVHNAAKENGWWDPRSPFDFTAAYSPFYPIPIRPLYVGRRIWRVFDLLAPSLQLDMRLGFMPYPTYPFAVTPDKPLTLDFLRFMLRDHYEGTPIDMTKGVAAGPFGNPIRFDGEMDGHGYWERDLSMYRATYSYIAQVRLLPQPLKGLLWFGLDAPHGTVYVPFYASQDVIPDSYVTGIQSEFNMHSAWWAFNFVNNWIQLKWSHMIKEVEAHQQHWETLAAKKLARWDIKATEMLKDRQPVQHFLEEETCTFAKDVISSQWRLAITLISKYSNGNILVGEGPHDMTVPGYPKEWLQYTNYVTYPGDTWRPMVKQVVMANRLPLHLALFGTLVVVIGFSLLTANQLRWTCPYQPLP